VPEVAVSGIAGLVVVGEDLEGCAAAGAAGFEVAAGHLLCGCPVAAFGDVGAGGGGGDVGVDPEGVQLVRLPEPVARAGRGEPGVDVDVQLRDGGGVRFWSWTSKTWW